MSAEKNSHETDEELIRRYQAGQPEVFKTLIDRYVASLYNFTARLTNINDANDIVQDVFIKIWKHLDRFDHHKASFKTWIFTIARNTTTDFLRKKKILLFSDLEKDSGDNLSSFEDNIPDDKLLPPEILVQLQDQELLNNTLAKISPAEQEILVLHYQEELTFEAISKILNKSLNTIKSKHRRVLIKLRTMLQ